METYIYHKISINNYFKREYLQFLKKYVNVYNKLTFTSIGFKIIE